MAAGDDERFAWHPDYRGQTVAEVRTTVRNALAGDQRAYALLLEGAEEHESAALASVLDLEKRWGVFDFGWAESDPDELAARIAAYEWTCEQRRERIPWEHYRDEIAPMPAVADNRPWWAFWRRA